MGNPKHILIENLSDEYVDNCFRGQTIDNSHREAVKAAYIAGAEATLERIDYLLNIHTDLKGIAKEQSDELKIFIEDVHSKLTSVRP